MNIPLTAYWSLFRRYLAPQRGRAALLAAVLLVGIGLQLANPQVLRLFIDAAVGGAASGDLLRAAALFLGLTLGVQVLTVLAGYLAETVGWEATNALRVDLAEHCLRLDLAFHNARTPGELIERVDGDVSALARFFAQLVVQVFGSLLLLAGVLVALAWEDWRLGVGATLFVLVSLLVLSYLRGRWVIEIARTRQAQAEAFGFLGEHLAATEDLRANGATGYSMRRFHELLIPWLRTYHRSRIADTTLWVASVLLFAVGSAVALGMGAYLLAEGTISIGTVFLIFYYMNLISDPIERIRTEFEHLQRAEAGIYRIRELFATQPSLKPGGHVPLPVGPLSVRVEGLSFSYATNSEAFERLSLEAVGRVNAEVDTGSPTHRLTHSPAPTLHNITFSLPAGQMLGLLGRTGSGKSTLARLLLGLYNPQQGTISLGGVPLHDTPRRHLPRHIGMVTQEVQLFQGSVRANLTFFDSTIRDADLYEALAMLGLLPWLERLPAGLDTRLGADGVGLSAGEAQLLAFARVFLKNPGLVILDEASSRLDPATEQLINKAMGRLFANRTGIIIAHRLQTVQRVDQIAILERGQIVEYGSRVALEQDAGSRFARLLRVGMAEMLT
jgi:ABC-type multidrug transport system fused ATPase/permease subunit